MKIRQIVSRPGAYTLRGLASLAGCISVIVLWYAEARLPGQNLSTVSPDKQTESVSGTIRIVGDVYAQEVVKRWTEQFIHLHPTAQIDADLDGTVTGMAGIYTGVAQMALMGRDPTVSEHDAFYFVFRREALGIEVMNGSLATPGKSSALVAFVHKSNPLTGLTLAQLEAIFGTEHKRGQKNIRTWGELGLKGEWAGKPINLYIYDAGSGSGSYFDHLVLEDSSKWNWEHLKEFQDITRAPNGFEYPAGQQILDALATDPYGLAVSSLRYTRPEVRPLPLASEAGGTYYDATRGNIVQRTYPLSRAVTIFVNKPVDQEMKPDIRELLHFILSKEGQLAVQNEGDYLPLSAERVEEQIRKVDGTPKH